MRQVVRRHALRRHALAIGSVLAMAAPGLQAATSARFPSANQVSSGAGWTNPSNAHADDGSYATAAPGKNSTLASIYQVAFSAADVPDGSTITAVAVEIQYRVDTTTSNPTLGSRLYSDSGMGTPLSAAFSDTNEPTTDTVVNYAATTQPTIAQLRSGLWVNVQAIRGNSNNAVVFSLDFVRVTVTYTPPVLTTAVGTVSVTNGAGPTPSLLVSATYTGDADGDNSLSWRYRTSPAGTWSASTNVAHAASPYAFTVSGLTCGTAHDVEVTYVDPDGVTGANPQTVTATPSNCTLAGTATAAQTPGATPSIAVSAPYTRDADGDNTLTYRFRPTGGSYGATTPLSHAASPYAFTLAGLTCGTSYDIEVTYSDADGVSGTALQTIAAVPVDHCTAAGTPTATVDACNLITVRAPFAFDLDADGTTTFERGPAAGGPWSAACSGVAGASPRSCADGGVLPSSTYYYRVSYADADGVSGTAQPVIGPFATPACETLPVTPAAPTAATVSCSRIDVTAPFTGDSDGDSATLVEVATAAGGPFTAVAGCTALGGASPRTCAANGLGQATAYWFRVDFSDPDGVAGTDPQVIGPQSTHDCRVAPQPPSAAAVSCTQATVSSPYSGDWDGDSTTTMSRGESATGPWTAVCNGATGASPRICTDLGVVANATYYYQVDFTDADGVLGTDPRVVGPVSIPVCVPADTTAGVATGLVTGCRQITVSAPFTGDGDQDGHVAFDYSATNTWPGTPACAMVTGSSPRTCIVTSLYPVTAYWVRATYVDPDGVSGTAVQVLNGGAPYTTPSCAGDGTGPTLSFLSPTRDAVIGGVERLKVQVYDRDGVPDGNVLWALDGGTLSAAGVARSTVYDCNSGTQTTCKVFEIDLDTTPPAIGNGPHWITVQATDAVSSVASASLPVVVNNAGSKAHGSGLVLRRTHGSQLCLDCHNVPSHSSQGTGNKYGNWAVDCLTCHTSHGTRNVYLVRETVETPASGRKTVVFQQSDRSGGTNPQKSHVGDYDAAGAPYDDGICETCHTRTSHYRNSTAGGDHTHNRTQRCMNCHQHARSFAASGCNGCHKAPPTVGKHGAHDEVWDSTDGNTASSYTDAASHATATQYGFACAKCHSGTHTNAANAGTLADPYLVEVAFDATTDPKNPAGSFAAGTVQTPDQGPSSDYWRWTDGSCGSTYCHSNAAPVGGTNSFKTVTWNQAATLTCASCHNLQARSDSGVATDLSNAHGKHLQSTSGETGGYAFKCDECHAQVIRDNPSSPWLLADVDLADKSKHVMGTHSVNFSGTSIVAGLNQSAGSYNQGPGYTCANTYCHSTGESTAAPFGSSTSIAWNTTADAECDSCHGGNATATTTTGKGSLATNDHVAHMNQASYLGTNFACGRCHNATVATANDRAVATLANHVNGVADVSMVDGGTYSGAATKTCSSAYCHSDGTETPAYKAGMDWNAGLSYTNDCKACHGSDAAPAFTAVYGEPNYTERVTTSDDARNSHSKHVSTTLATAKTQCVDCHAAAVNADGTLKAAGTHLNKAVEITTGGKIGTWTAAGETCGNITCHGGNGASWGGPSLGCASCHGGAADLNNWDIADGTISKVNTGTEWTTYGHGNAAAGFAGANICLYCHDDSVGHSTATNPFRLRGAANASGVTTAYNAASASNGNDICVNCHDFESGTRYGVDPDGASAGYTLKKAASSFVDAWHHGADHSATQDGGKRCWDCHDPHGDLTNIFMIGSDTLRDAGDNYGLTGTRSPTNAVFTSSAAGGYAKATTPFTGICQVCHTTTSYYLATGTLQTHNTGSDCITCHAHQQPPGNAFKGAGSCRDCHSSRTGAIPRAQVIGGAAGSEGDDFIRPSRHVSNGTATSVVTDFDCILCHAEGDVTSSGTDIKALPATHGGDGGTSTVDLRNVDSSGGTGVQVAWPGKRLASFTATTANRDGMDSFCMSCHDANGASNIAVNAANSGLETSTNGTASRRLTPFNSADTRANAHDPAELNLLRTRVIDVKSQFNSTNLAGKNFASHHNLNQFAKRYSTVNANWPASTWTAYVTKEGQTLNAAAVRETAGLHCSDCHLNEVNAHGTRNTWYMLASASFSDATADVKFTGTGLPGGTDHCFRCHSSAAYGMGGTLSGSASRTDAHTTACPRIEGADVQGNRGATLGMDDAGTQHQLTCLMCHGGGGLGWIHGMNFTYRPWKGGVDSKTYRFQGGGGTWRWYSPIEAAPASAAEAETMWEGTGTAGCYTLAAADAYGGCTQHGSGGKTAPSNYARPLNY